MSKATYFISDLHLSPETPALNTLFKQALKEWEQEAETLYILGDLFEYWAGDDQLNDPFYADLAATLKQASRSMTVYFVAGNRDFLAGSAFEAATGATILPDNSIVKLYGQDIVIAHGDALCTDDVKYQQFRAMVRNPQWKEQFLALPLPVRLQQIAEVRQKSEESKQQARDISIMDVNQEAVDALIRANDYKVLIHGHTHRPAVHEWELDENACERWVLPDWYDKEGGFMRADNQGWSMEMF